MAWCPPLQCNPATWPSDIAILNCKVSSHNVVILQQLVSPDSAIVVSLYEVFPPSCTGISCCNPPVIACTATLHCNLWCHSLLVPSLPALSPWYLNHFKNLLIMTWQHQLGTPNFVWFSTTIIPTISQKHIKYCFQVCLLTCKIM